MTRRWGAPCHNGNHPVHLERKPKRRTAHRGRVHSVSEATPGRGASVARALQGTAPCARTGGRWSEGRWRQGTVLGRVKHDPSRGMAETQIKHPFTGPTPPRPLFLNVLKRNLRHLQRSQHFLRRWRWPSAQFRAARFATPKLTRHPITPPQRGM